MRYLTSQVVLTLSLSAIAHCKSIYLDSSCTSRLEWNDYWSETIQLATRGSERMQSQSDTDFQAVFKRIFLTDTTSSDATYVQDVLDRIAGLTVTTDLKSSEIRMYCDNDARWTQLSNGNWYDASSDMLEPVAPICHDPRKGGHTYTRRPKAPTDQNDPRYGHHPDRAAITICERTFTPYKTSKGVDLPLRLSQNVRNTNMNNMPTFALSFTVSHTILHELAHAVTALGAASDFTDVKDLPNINSAYGWVNIIQKDTPMATKNADNYFFLGLWAVLGDLGYTLPRITPDLDATEKQTRETKAVQGLAAKYADITKRMLRAIVGISYSA